MEEKINSILSYDFLKINESETQSEKSNTS